MRPLEGRIAALERARANVLPTVHLTFSDGTQAGIDALGAYLHMVQHDAGKAGVKPFVSVMIGGPMPTAGAVWATLADDLNDRAKGGETNVLR